MKLLLITLLSSLITLNCTKPLKMGEYNEISNINNQAKYTYLALGDSYTIGESVPQNQSFPYQLKNLLGKENLQVAPPKIIATTGWTTDELQQAIKQSNLNQKFDFVTLLIGVNNQYRGYPIETYKKEFGELLQTAIAFANGNKKHVFVISIPDWGATPFGLNSGKNIQTIENEINAYNLVNKEITLQQGIRYLDITPASRNARQNLSLIASDGLHPSEKMHGEWANELLPIVIAGLQ